MKIFSRKILIIIVIVTGLASWWVMRTKDQKPVVLEQPVINQNTNESPKIVSTKPDPLEEAIVSAADIIEITFNRPLENVGEFKNRIEPETSYKVELSGDRKTARIIPVKPFELGLGYTLFIGPETKFDGIGRWGEEKIFHFRTIRYRGI